MNDPIVTNYTNLSNIDYVNKAAARGIDRTDNKKGGSVFHRPLLNDLYYLLVTKSILLRFLIQPIDKVKEYPKVGGYHAQNKVHLQFHRVTKMMHPFPDCFERLDFKAPK